MILQQWRLWAALALVGFWIWRVVVMPSPIGLVLFATSALLPLAVILGISAFRRASQEAEA